MIHRIIKEPVYEHRYKCVLCGQGRRWGLDLLVGPHNFRPLLKCGSRVCSKLSYTPHRYVETVEI